MRWVLGSGRYWLAGALAVLLVAGVAFTATGGFGTGADDADAVDCSASEAESAADAARVAVACGFEVEVTGERTPWETSWAQPDGLSRLDVSAVPVRVEVDGEWVEPDSSLVVDENGDVAVAAPVYPTVLNPGGAAGAGRALGVIEREGMRLEVGFPLDLPIPEVSGTQAVY
ncbi:hypothetical protein ARHIZOSPH14_21500 [Agromyces rhizosphaerae]|uniref:Uncharacterized protein n=1 Tax=Agromyces rhizosphaerae TaxID=88374 RepID=A0A9W6D1P6_9MICO|nr:hypothetical protein [Agromyces rhizosphaerae]GLI27908.1 hypothetical protein ARHIZOSPH14_21500 [Agromyces rhizosphaerae]